MAASCDRVQINTDRVHGLQSLLDPEGPLLQHGELLPPLWHWVALPSWPDPASTGADGHPSRPAELRDAPVRRMFAGGAVTFGEVPLRLGEQVTVTTELSDIAEKAGRSGDFVLAASTTTVRSLAGDVALTERQDIVYTHPRQSDLDAPQGPLHIVGRPLVPRPDGGVHLVTDPTVLLRFSALTSNAHRIHYDLAYAKDVEGLPGLLVQGPLINLVLAGLASRGRPVRRIRHRNLSPLFVGQPAALAANQSAPREMTAEATSSDGRTTSRVVVELHET